MTLGTRCLFIPPYLLDRIAGSGSEAADHCRATLEIDERFAAMS